MPVFAARRRRPRVIWIIVTIAAILLLTLLIFSLVMAQAASQQPFPYPHATHVEKGIACIYCHSGAYRGQSAGLPTKAKCQGCHQNINPETPLAQQWQEYAKTHDQIEWVPVALMPDYIYFSHQPHLNAGLDCVNCHGEVGKMTTAEPQKYWNMGWCLECHKTMAPEKFVKLSDCATCHK